MLGKLRHLTYEVTLNTGEDKNKCGPTKHHKELQGTENSAKSYTSNFEVLINSDGIQNFKNRFSFVSYLPTTGSLIKV